MSPYLDALGVFRVYGGRQKEVKRCLGMRGGKGNDEDRSCAKGREITGLIVNLASVA